jgi:hypothetical protein
MIHRFKTTVSVVLAQRRASYSASCMAGSGIAGPIDVGRERTVSFRPIWQAGITSSIKLLGLATRGNSLSLGYSVCGMGVGVQKCNGVILFHVWAPGAVMLATIPTLRTTTLKMSDSECRAAIIFPLHDTSKSGAQIFAKNSNCRENIVFSNQVLPRFTAVSSSSITLLG